MNLEAALAWAKQAEAEDLCGMSAMAVRVLAAEVERLTFQPTPENMERVTVIPTKLWNALTKELGHEI